MTVHFVPPVIDGPRQAKVDAIAMQGDDAAVVRFEGIEDVDAAEMLVGCHCLVARSAIDGELLESLSGEAVPSFEGWTFVDEASGRTGAIVGLDEMPGQVMLSLAVEGEEGSVRMVPLVDDFIVTEDEGAKLLTLSLPGGLLDL